MVSVLLVPPAASGSAMSVEVEAGALGVSFERNQFFGFSRAANPFFGFTGADAVPVDGFVTAVPEETVWRLRGSTTGAVSRAGLIGSFSDKRTISTFVGGAASRLAGGAEVAAATRGGVVGFGTFVRCDKTTGATRVAELSGGLCVAPFVAGLLVTTCGALDWVSAAVGGGAFVRGGRA